jgi:hypothetical protein
MEAYCQEVRCLEDKFHGLELNHIARRYNEAVDELAKITSSQATVPPDVFAKDLQQSSVDLRPDRGVGGTSLDPPPEAEAPSTGAEAMQVEGSTSLPNLEPDWRVLDLDYLIRGDLPSGKTEARRIARRAKTFVIMGDNGELYRHSPTGILQRCITNEQGRNLLGDLHSGACGHHAAPRTLIGNAFRQGFYWPTVVSNAVKLVRSCKGCQYYARRTHLPTHALQTIPITWSFAVWGLDLVGPLKRAAGGFTHLLVLSPASGPSKLCSFSPALFIASGSLTVSSQTMAPSSLAKSFWISATATTSECSGQPWPMQKQTVRWNVPMVWSYKA